MSAQNTETPISDSTPHTVGDLAMVCRRLERKLAATRHYLAVVTNRAKRLEEGGGLALGFAAKGDFHSADEVWLEAKEAKP